MARICSEPYPEKDKTWSSIDVCFARKFKKIVTLEKLKSEKSLKNMLAVKKGGRLSIQPVSRADFHRVLKLTK